MPWWHKKRGAHGRKTVTGVTKAYKELQALRLADETEARAQRQADADADRLRRATEHTAMQRKIRMLVMARKAHDRERFDRANRDNAKTEHITLKRLHDMAEASRLNAEKFARDQEERRRRYEEELRQREVEEELFRKAMEREAHEREQAQIRKEQATVRGRKGAGANTRGGKPGPSLRVRVRLLWGRVCKSRCCCHSSVGVIFTHVWCACVYFSCLVPVQSPSDLTLTPTPPITTTPPMTTPPHPFPTRRYYMFFFLCAGNRVVHVPPLLPAGNVVLCAPYPPRAPHPTLAPLLHMLRSFRSYRWVKGWASSRAATRKGTTRCRPASARRTTW